MNAPKFPWEDDPIGFLINRKFPALVALEDQRTRAGNEELEARYREIKQQSDAYFDHLVAMKPTDLGTLFDREKVRFFDELVFEVQLLDDGRFFSEPFTNADIQFWSRISYWTADEAVALSFGKDPRLVHWSRLEPIGDWSLFVSAYRARLELARRAIEAGQIAEKTAPYYFLAWAARTGFPMPEELVSAVAAIGNQIADWKSEYDRLVEFIGERNRETERTQAQLETERVKALEALAVMRSAHDGLAKELADLKASTGGTPQTAPGYGGLSTRERDTLLKIVIGMAVEGYCYDPKAARSTAIPDIVTDLEKTGVAVSDDTVRKYLREAAEHLPRDA